MRDELRRTAAEVFGWLKLRDEQLIAMEHLTAGQDVLAVLPTGAGKSAIYQVPALLLDGPTVVVSPLIALQHDQRNSLAESDAPDAVIVNSTPAGREDRAGLDRGARGRRGVLVPRSRTAGQGRGRRGVTAGRGLAVRRRRGALRVGVGA